jgi:hypothetical protein
LHRGECAVLIGPTAAARPPSSRVTGPAAAFAGPVQVGGSEVRSSLKVGYLAHSHDRSTASARCWRSWWRAKRWMPPRAGVLARTCSRATTCSSRSTCSRWGRARLALALLALEGANFWCWTSLPITWTSRRARRCRRCWIISAVRSCWFRTTVS